MAETKNDTGTRPKPASGALPGPHDKLMVVGGEEAGSLDRAVPAIVVRARTVGEDDPRGWRAGEHRADVVVFNSSGSAATPYTDVLVLGSDSEARRWLDDAEPGRRQPEDTSPLQRGLVAFWPSR